MLSDARPELADVDSALHIGLAKDRYDRFTSCTDFVRAIADRSRHDGSSPTVFAALPPAPTPRVHDVAPETSRHAKEIPRWLYTAGALLLVTAVGLAIWRPWVDHHDAQPADPVVSGTTSAVQDSSTSTPAASQAPTVPASDVAEVLLTAPEISKVMGEIEVSADPTNTYSSVLKMDASSYGPADRSREVNPPECAGAAFTGDQSAYGESDVESMKTESFSPGPHVVGDEGPWQLQQTAAAFPSAEAAANFLADRQGQWAMCSNTPNLPYPNFPDIAVSVTFGYENGRSFRLGEVQRSGDMIAISMASNDPVCLAHACQQALGVRNNLVVEARTCQVPRNAASIGGLEPADPDWATPDAQHLVAAMLNNVI